MEGQRCNLRPSRRIINTNTHSCPKRTDRNDKSVNRNTRIPMLHPRNRRLLCTDTLSKLSLRKIICLTTATNLRTKIQAKVDKDHAIRRDPQDFSRRIYDTNSFGLKLCAFFLSIILTPCRALEAASYSAASRL